MSALRPAKHEGRTVYVKAEGSPIVHILADTHTNTLCVGVRVSRTKYVDGPATCITCKTEEAMIVGGFYA